MSVADTKFELCHDVEQVLKIGRDFQKQDSWRGAHHDTAKLLCDTIEYLREQLNAQIGNAAAIREAAAEFVSVILDKKPGIHNLHRLAEKCRDALAERIERYASTSPAMDRAMPGIPMVRVLDPDTGKEIVRGWYAAYPETTYCCAEDYERNPPRLVEGVVCWQMTDWGLPNRIGFRQVTDPHRIEIIPQGESRKDSK